MKKILIGHCAVDSGMLLIGDPCYILDGKTPKKDEELYQKSVQIALEKRYGEVLLSQKAGIGIITTTFDGDGSYPIYAEIDKTGLPKKIIIKLH